MRPGRSCAPSQPDLKWRFESPRITVMKRFLAFCLAAWSAAALLYFGRHSAALIALSGVIALAGFDLLRPDSNHGA
ncbi:membrane protein [Caballeronia pedi]|uniref:Membrane protein n=2 Tax=Caballeronia pedi TaxID=1777141 RepID=A0A158BYA7_9BURK|nr:membrane protein [Caballeronia pedi]